MTNLNPNDIPVYNPDGDDSGFTLPEGLYNKLKTIVMVILPAAVTLYVTLAALWDWGNTDKVVGTVTAVTALLGVLLKVTKKNYDNSEAKYDGAIDIISHPDGDLMNVRIDPAAVADKDSMFIKINQPPGS